MSAGTTLTSASRTLDPPPAHGVRSPVLAPFAEFLQRWFAQRPSLARNPHP